MTLRYQGRLHHIGTGAAYKGWRIAMLIEGRKIELVGLDGSPMPVTGRPTKDGGAGSYRGSFRSRYQWRTTAGNHSSS
jgi:hypothetical protein